MGPSSEYMLEKCSPLHFQFPGESLEFEENIKVEVIECQRGRLYILNLMEIGIVILSIV